MRILFVTVEYPPLVGGIASHVYELAKALHASGHAITVIAPDMQGAQLFDHYHTSFPVLRYKLPITAKPFYGYFLGRRIIDHLQKSPADVVHIHGLRPLTAIAKVDLPIVFTNHTSGFLKRLHAPASKQDATATLINHASHLIAPSRELLEASHRIGYSNASEYIPNGVDETKFYPDERRGKKIRDTWGIKRDEVVVLLARRLAKKNGVIYAARAIKYLRGTPCKLVFAGDGEERKRIEETISSCGMMGQALFLGSVVNDLMPDIYRAADICLLPSLMEATSIAGLEAMASGKPLIGTTVGGIPDLIEQNVTGLLVPPEDEQALGNAMLQLINQPDRRLTMGTCARQRVEAQFTWKKIAAATANVLERALERGRSTVDA